MIKNEIKLDYWFDTENRFKQCFRDIIERCANDKTAAIRTVLPHSIPFDGIDLPSEWLYENVQRAWVGVPNGNSWIVFFDDEADALAFRMTF